MKPNTQAFYLSIITGIFYFSFIHHIQAQTFSAQPNVAIQSDSCVFDQSFQIDLSAENLPILNGTDFGLVQICWDIQHNWIDDIDVWLRAPDGTVVELSTDNGSIGDNYINTCVQMDGQDGFIIYASSPFTGEFIPEANMHDVNNSQNPNGIWTLEVCDDVLGFSGTLQNWSITFGNPIDNVFALSDSLALVAFYEWHIGDDWLDNDGWLQPNVPIKDWLGVSVNSENAVTKIELPNNNLVNDLFPNIDLIFNLTTLDLASNQLSSVLNPNLLQLEYLDTLIMSNNAHFVDTFANSYLPLCNLALANFENTGLEIFDEFCEVLEPKSFWAGTNPEWVIGNLGTQNFSLGDSLLIDGIWNRELKGSDYYTYNIGGEVFMYNIQENIHRPFLNFDAEVGDTFQYAYQFEWSTGVEYFATFIVDSIHYKHVIGMDSLRTQYVHALDGYLGNYPNIVEIHEGIGYNFGFFPMLELPNFVRISEVCNFNNEELGTVEFIAYTECGEILDVKEISQEALIVYPNPTNDFINIEIPIEHGVSFLKLHNSTGQNISNFKFNQPGLNKIDVSNLLHGMYILELQDADQNVLGVSKVVVGI